ncbi:syndecan-2 isoform X2 [Oncorhynchus mykiss]|uniref:Syndecan n=1 Tax=Oncorhynchus mykiss TaxID=8022 RepID=A0A8C7RYL0_ONCMY|nr:syndecan-2 isoform X2 [Oncorhynchus mykiss]
MTNTWILLTLALATCFMSETILISAQSDYLYLDDQSGDSVDDDGYNSGSGSGDMIIGEATEPVKVKRVFAAPEAEPTQDSLPALSTTMEMLTFTDLSTEIAETETETETETQVPEQSLDVTEETVISSEAPPSTTGASGLLYEADAPYDVHSENLFQRTEVLAAVIAGGVIGLLFAIFLILLLVYRMRKKDEGSYVLGERKAPSSAYQKAPTKEFYA